MTTVLTLPGALGSWDSLPPMLDGEVTSTNTILEVHYNNFDTSDAGMVDGRDKLNTAIHATAGNKVVFGHSMGARVIGWWLSHYGPTSTVPPSELSFVQVGNSESWYGGVLFNSATAIPKNTPYTVLEVKRQYEGWCDWPMGLDSPPFDGQTTGYVDVARVLAQETGLFFRNPDALTNAVLGMNTLHSLYNQVGIHDPQNVSFVEGNITYVWCPTYPMPLAAQWSWWPSQMQQVDATKRPIVESVYHRPVKLTGGKAVSVNLKHELDVIEDTCDKLRKGLG